MNIIEYTRKQIITQLYDTIFGVCFPTWKEGFNKYAPDLTEVQLFNLGDYLGEIFQSTATDRSQGGVAGGGSAWEALICWYLNLCLIGRRTIVIKHNKRFIPQSVSDAITVNYGNFRSNTESDLIAITFPDEIEFQTDIDSLYGVAVSQTINFPGIQQLFNSFTSKNFSQIEIHIIQTKTNWNDNAQIPMMWDAIYSAQSFSNGISIGTNGYSIHDIRRFTYSFVTVPTNKLHLFKPTSTCVLRVRQLSGGNYWGRPTKQGVANSVKEMLDRNLRNGAKESILSSIKTAAPKLHTEYSYFGL